MRKVVISFFLCMLAGITAYAQRTYTPEQARQLFDQKYDMVFGSQGATLHYAVNIIGIYKTEGTIWYKGQKSKFIDEKYIAWNDGTTYTRVERKKQEVVIYGANDEARDKYATKFSFEPNNYTYAAYEEGDQLIITLKAKKGVKGVKEAQCYINRLSGYPEGVRVKVFIFSTTIKITNFQSGGISDDLFVFPRQTYADYTYVDNRK
ncbi:MAG: hypothetical protein J6T82_03285 [Bacteroidaceae bacterium]|nr:hypothetical protein [Bacteroidaceae bacterium]